MTELRDIQLFIVFLCGVELGVAIGYAVFTFTAMIFYPSESTVAGFKKLWRVK